MSKVPPSFVSVTLRLRFDGGGALLDNAWTLSLWLKAASKLELVLIYKDVTYVPINIILKDIVWHFYFHAMLRIFTGCIVRLVIFLHTDTIVVVWNIIVCQNSFGLSKIWHCLQKIRRLIRSFSRCLKPLLQSEAKCEAIDTKTISFYSQANKIHFTRKVSHIVSFWKLGFWNSEIINK